MLYLYLEAVDFVNLHNEHLDTLIDSFASCTNALTTGQLTGSRYHLDPPPEAQFLHITQIY